MTDYGPNTPHVEALLAQVRAMTPSVIRIAQREWEADFATESDHRWVDAIEFIEDRLPHDFAASQAWNVARVGAKNAAHDALLALVARDLITPDGPWNQAAYDLLTGPLRKAGITVHSDDPALEDQ